MTLTPWWSPAAHADRRPLLLARNAIQRACRDWFQAEGFTEVDPAGLSVSPGNEAHLHAFATRLTGPDGADQTRYLHTSPEFAMKKLLAAGETRIHAFAHVWRRGEDGPRHAAEFTMLEWYRADEPYDRVIADAVALLRLAARAAGAALFRHGAATCDPMAEPERLTMRAAFARAGIDLDATLTPSGEGDLPAMRRAATAAGLTVRAGDGWSDLFSRLLVAFVDPRLGHGRPTILDRWPAPEAALARRCADDPRYAERFEVYAAGVELANGFGELTDPEEQRRRLAAEMDEKERVHGERYPLDEDFLAALAQMPAASGIALGFDRLVMLATGAPRIDMVQWAPAPA